MSIPWDALDHAGIVLDYSKIIVGAAVAANKFGVFGSGISATTGLVGNRNDLEDQLLAVIKRWRFILDNLTAEETAAIERAKPGSIAGMDRTMKELTERLKFMSLELKTATAWQRAWPFSSVSDEVKKTFRLFNRADDDLTATTHGFVGVNLNPVTAILDANAAVETMNVEMIPLAAPGANDQITGNTSAQEPQAPAGTNPGVVVARVGSAPNAVDTAVMTASSQYTAVPADVVAAYRSAVGMTSALLPAVLRRPRIRHSDTSPV